MNNKDNTNKNIIAFLVIFTIFVGGYFLLHNLTNKNGNEYEEFLKDYDVNEYISTYISDEDMAKIYLNDYIHKMYYNVEEAYNLIDAKYRNAKFPTLESYKSYVESKVYPTYNLTKYYTSTKDGYLYFGVYDDHENVYIFKTKGVMQYTVFLDDTTVEI